MVSAKSADTTGKGSDISFDTINGIIVSNIYMISCHLINDIKIKDKIR